MRLKKRLLALALAVLLVLPGVLLSPALPVSAQTTLYGTGSADEINIIKLLDMALNKGGMSMSPATIRAFLDYWWSSVQADLAKCISNAGSAITTTQDFADYLYMALENADHYDRLGGIIKKYIQYVLTMEYKSLSDFKQLLTQQGTFRRFLLSYVTDADGNIAGTVDNKLAKYNIGKDFVNMARQAADSYIEEYEGYYLVPTFTYKDISPSICQTKEYYETLTAILRKIPDGGLYGFYVNKSYFYDLDYPNLNFVNNPYSRPEYGNWDVYLYNDNWQKITSLDRSFISAEALEQFPAMTDRFSLSAQRFSFQAYLPDSSTGSNLCLFTKDGFSVKVWKSLDAFKAYTIGKSNIYYSSSYSAFDNSVDNSIEFTGSYYSSSSSYSHDIIQNTIDNSSEVNESTVNNIVNNYITNNNYGDSSGGGSGSGPGGSSSGSGSWWDIGSGIDSFVKGIAALLDFVLKLLGDLVGLLGRFLTDVLEVFKSLGVVGSGFGEFLKEVFGFLPDECISLIMSSIGAMCIVGVVKAFKK